MQFSDNKAVMGDEEMARQLQAEEDAAYAKSQADQDSFTPTPAPNNDPRMVPVSSRMAGDGATAFYAPPPGLPPQAPQHQVSSSRPVSQAPTHVNQLSRASHLRAQDEQQMQNWLQKLQYDNGIYNSELEPEHDSDYPCGCPIHQYQRAKWARSDVQDAWNAAVLYPGEKAYNSNKPYNSGLFSGNPYQYRITSPYFGTFQGSWGPKRASPRSHSQWITQTIGLNNSLNRDAQTAIDGREPRISIWGEDDEKETNRDAKAADGMDKLTKDVKGLSVEPPSYSGTTTPTSANGSTSKISKFRKSFGIKSGEERQEAKAAKLASKGDSLRASILEEEQGRWPDQQWKALVLAYQEHIGMAKKVAHLRAHCPIQYSHLLRAGYFEPIPVAWANQASNPLKFSIEANTGWRGITPAWRGYEDTAEERLYWVLNHREGSTGTRLKPDFISALDLARQRMTTAVAPPPQYYDVNDTCNVQHTSSSYSKQVLPPPFRAYDRPEKSSDDTMILLDVSGSMDFVPQRPNYDRYLITGYQNTHQPKNKDLAKAIIRRFTDAMTNHDHSFAGYDLTTFSSSARFIGTVTHRNLDALWKTISIGGGTRVMTGWQKVKDLHFRKHSESAIHHPVYGWQAGPNTPMLRLLLLLDGEATDMDEFELDLLGLSWAHVTIFLIGVDGCPHHHRHANELQRISDVNHHVSFVDAQGNTPERYVTHELLKRHLGYDISMHEFQQIEVPPTYEEATK